MNRNARLGVGLTLVISAMVGVAFASVPLYRLFCAATGFNGTPQIGGAAGPGAAGGLITVRFDANTNAALPWRFMPVQHNVTLPLGEERVAYYEARNLGATAVTGVATYNVTPEKAGKYFHKTACFCFDEQTLTPDQTMQFPLSFWVDPAIASDPNTADIRTITLSYSFFRAADDAARTAAVVAAGPHVGKRVP